MKTKGNVGIAACFSTEGFIRPWCHSGIQHISHSGPGAILYCWLLVAAAVQVGWNDEALDSPVQQPTFRRLHYATF